MQEQFVVTGKDEDGIRVLDARAMLSHNAHIKERGRTSSERCAFCTKGVGSVIKTVESRPISDYGILSRRRTDEEETAASTLTSGELERLASAMSPQPSDDKKGVASE